MSLQADSENSVEDPSRRYWKAAISALSPAKRDAAWEFYISHFADSETGDTLSGLLLLLEANSIYLEGLPERYHADLVFPLKARLESFQNGLVRNEERLIDAVSSLNRACEKCKETEAATSNAAASVQRCVREAAASVNIKTLTDSITQQIREGALLPFAQKISDLSASTEDIEKAAEHARSSVDAWRRVHLAGIIANGWGVGFLALTILFLFGWTKLNSGFEQRVNRVCYQITQDLNTNQETLRKLAELHVAIRLLPVGSSIEAPSDALVAEPAEDAVYDTRDGAKRGVIYLRKKN